MPIVGDGLKHTHAVALSVDERDILSNAGRSPDAKLRGAYFFCSAFNASRLAALGRKALPAFQFARNIPIANRANALFF